LRYQRHERHVYDFDDTRERTVIHPTGPVAAPLFAFAELAFWWKT